MKAFVTGGTGFIGNCVVTKLLERGYQVTALVRSIESGSTLHAAGANLVVGDITNVESMRESMRGKDVVFHIAGWYKLGARDTRMAEVVNVEGTRNVLGLAYELGIPKIVYTSTVAVYGDTHGVIVDENTPLPEGPFLTEYDRTKWMAHKKVALPLIQQGAPVIIVMPGGVFGPGDPSLLGEMMRWFYKGLFPVLPGPELTLTFACVDDIAEGHILAAEKGKPGESYFLAGPIYSVGEMVKVWARLSEKRPPFLYIPARYVKPFAPFMDKVAQFVNLPAIFSRDSIIILDATYLARSNKARAQLGWRLHPLHESIHDTFNWIRTSQATPNPALVAQRNRRIAGIALGVALSLLFTWIVTHPRRALKKQ